MKFISACADLMMCIFHVDALCMYDTARLQSGLLLQFGADTLVRCLLYHPTINVRALKALTLICALIIPPPTQSSGRRYSVFQQKFLSFFLSPMDLWDGYTDREPL